MGENKKQLNVMDESRSPIMTILLLGIRVFGLPLEKAYIVVAGEITVRMILFYIRYKGGRWKTIMQEMEKKSVVKN